MTDATPATVQPLRTAVIGAAGYAGGELLRLLLAHPGAEVVLASSRTHEGRPVGDVHRNLRGYTDLHFTAPDARAAAEMDWVFLGLPHGHATAFVQDLLAEGRDTPVCDLSADFRHHDGARYAAAYGGEHPDIELARTFIYALPELRGEDLAGARRLAAPGCFATAILLGLAPLAEAGLLPDRVQTAAATGSSGSGRTPGPVTHHPERAGAFRAYKVLRHQHRAEILEELERGGWTGTLDFVPHSAPMVRGIHAVSFLGDADPEAVRACLRERHAGSPSVRVLGPEDPHPDCAVVAGSPHADLAVVGSEDGTGTVVLCAIDNLLKGAASQAVQAWNMARGLDPGLGLGGPGGRP